MFDLTWWWLLLLLPLPLIAKFILPATNPVLTALTIPFLHRQQSSSLTSTSSWLASISLWIFWVCLVLAACRPFWLGEATHRTVTGRDLMLAIDISGSMKEADMVVGSKFSTRIDVLKTVVTEFISRREGDRLGLILFGTRAYTYVPLTFDRDALNELLIDASTGLAGRLTAITDAIGIAIKTLGEQESRHKVLILVTDGSNTAGDDDPLNAARVANHVGMTIYTIGVGNDEKMMRQLTQGQNLPPGTALNEKLLRRIAAVTGGQYFRARDTASLERIYEALDELEPADLDAPFHRPRKDLFQWPLIIGMSVVIAFLCYTIWVSIRMRRQ
ncbi:MAG: VWA domain-containing protein [Gammaproteobacteria bacterium]